MKIKLVLLLTVSFFAVLSISSCKKKGCTDRVPEIKNRASPDEYA